MDIFVGTSRAVFGSEFEGGEVGFVKFAEAEGIGDEAFASFDFNVIRGRSLAPAYLQWI